MPVKQGSDGDLVVLEAAPSVTPRREEEAVRGDLSRRGVLLAGVHLGAAILVPGCVAVPRVSATRTAQTRGSNMQYDIVIVGGGPGGLAAALTLGRSRKRVLLCDSGPRRNAAAERIHNFVTRDGAPPEEFRRIGRAQLAAYPNVEVRDVRVESIVGPRGALRVHFSSGSVQARRVLLCTGMIDELPPMDGFRELWGHAIFQCPYCHGWEARERPWGYLARAAEAGRFLPFALLLCGWTRDLVVFMDETFDVPAETRTRLQAAGVRIETDPVRRLVTRQRQLEAVGLSTGVTVPCEFLFTHPSQRQVDLVRSLGVALDDHGYVRIDEMRSETSVPGIYAAGDLTTRGQGAIWAAAAAARAATMINFDLAMEHSPDGGA